MAYPPNKLAEQLRAKMIENAAEINRLQSRIHETVQGREESEEAHKDWSQACAEMHARYAELCLPGGPYPDFYDRIRAGDTEMMEVALCFLEVRPYFFRSGYHWKTILQKCKQAPMSGEQSERFRALMEKYSQWRSLRRPSTERGAAIARELWPLRKQFHGLFPIKLANHKFDGLVTVGDLYRILCNALKVEPLVHPEGTEGKVRERRRAIPHADMSAWAREYAAWRFGAWSPEDIWATLVSLIGEVYNLEPAFPVSPETVLILPAEK